MKVELLAIDYDCVARVVTALQIENRRLVLLVLDQNQQVDLWRHLAIDLIASETHSNCT